MQEDQKHVCKFCFKSFRCGRSLGGHMRSHLINISSPKSDPNNKIRKRMSKKSDQDSCLLEEEEKECGKALQSCKALFGHMKSHSLIVGQESWNSSSDHHNNHTENEGLCKRKKKKKRSNRAKRYDTTTTTTNSSSSLTTHNIDHQDQQEVALSLILLSMDSIVESSSNVKLTTSVKKLETDESGGPLVQRKKRLKSVSSDEFFESEVNSPKTMMNKSCNEFGSETDKTTTTTKFRCVICKKGFLSYQALGGHRASHKKFKGCCAPTTESEENSPLVEQKIEMGMERKKNKVDHECPICFKVFQSGQALGGHKRSHILAHAHQPKTCPPQIRDFLDLNLPAPVEDDDDEFKPWWINGATHNHQLDPLISSL